MFWKQNIRVCKFWVEAFEWWFDSTDLQIVSKVCFVNEVQQQTNDWSKNKSEMNIIRSNPKGGLSFFSINFLNPLLWKFESGEVAEINASRVG